MRVSSEERKSPVAGRGTRRLPVAENALFWMLLLLLSIGGLTSLYERSLYTGATAHAGVSPGRGERAVSSGGIFKGAALRAGTPRAALTFDVAPENAAPENAASGDAVPGDANTRRILDILDRYDVKATFFVTGDWVEAYPDALRNMAGQGHELGSRGAGLCTADGLSRRELRGELQEELQAVHDRVKRLVGEDMAVFRPPYGNYGTDNKDEVTKTAESMGYYPVFWDIDSQDWKDYGAEAIVKQIIDNPQLGDGSIILMHSAAKYTPSALGAVIEGLRAKGWELVPVSELMGQNQYRSIKQD